MDKNPHHPSTASTQRGAAAIEFAFILPLLLLIFTGMIEFGRAMWHYDALAKGARDAARYLSTVPTTDLDSAASLTNLCTSVPTPAYCIVANAASRAGVAGLTPASDITIACAPTACDSALSPADVTTVTVDINYPFVIGGWIPVFGPSPADAPSVITTALAPHVTMRYMR